MEDILERVYDAVSVAPDHVYSYLRERFSVTVKEPPHVFEVRLDVLDTAADDLIRAGKVDGAMQGLILGGGGALSIPLDVASLMAASVRMTQKVALVYGFGIHSDEEKTAIWVALAHATGITHVDDGSSRVLLSSVPNVLQNSPYRRVVIFKLLREIAEQIPIRLGARTFGRLIPLLGGAIGATSNFRFLQEVGAAAKIDFRERHVLRRTATDDKPASE